MGRIDQQSLRGTLRMHRTLRIENRLRNVMPRDDELHRYFRESEFNGGFHSIMNGAR